MKADYEPSDYAVATIEFVLHMDRYITEQYGPRCSDYEPGCVVCKMWRLRDDMAEIAV